jgi:nucleoside-diphosphate-sugar epimerase
MKFLVTGGCGLIGHNVVHRLENSGHDVRIVDTLTDYGIIPQDELDYLMLERRKKIRSPLYRVCIASGAVDHIIREFKPDVIVHLASFPRQKVVNVNPALGSRIMSEGLLGLLESSVKHGVGKFVYASSSMVYGDFKDDATEDHPCRPQGQYGILKLSGEWLIRDYTRKTSGGLRHCILRPSAVYGPLDVKDRVISQFMLTALSGGILKVNGPDETLDFTYVDDAADGIVAASLSENTDNKTYNITKSHSWRLEDAAKLAIHIAGSGSIDVRGRDLDFPSRGSLNIDRARRDFGFNPKMDVEDGFRKYHEWFVNSAYWRHKIGIR